jgi:hypothetical protein
MALGSGTVPGRSLSSTAALIALVCIAAAVGAWAADESHPCAPIVDDARRLACYDEAFGTPDSPANDAARREQSNYSFSALVSGLERSGDRFVATLDNGQVWSQTETNTRIDVRVGDTVTIRRGALGSYLLSDGEGLATRVKRLR